MLQEDGRISSSITMIPHKYSTLGASRKEKREEDEDEEAVCPVWTSRESPISALGRAEEDKTLRRKLRGIALPPLESLTSFGPRHRSSFG